MNTGLVIGLVIGGLVALLLIGADTSGVQWIKSDGRGDVKVVRNTSNDESSFFENLLYWVVILVVFGGAGYLIDKFIF